MFSLICAWINGGVNNRKAGDLRHHRAHYGVTVMCFAYKFRAQRNIPTEFLKDNTILKVFVNVNAVFLTRCTRLNLSICSRLHVTWIHRGIVMLNGVIDLGQPCFTLWLLTIRQPGYCWLFCCQSIITILSDFLRTFQELTFEAPHANGDHFVLTWMHVKLCKVHNSWLYFILCGYLRTMESQAM